MKNPTNNLRLIPAFRTFHERPEISGYECTYEALFIQCVILKTTASFLFYILAVFIAGLLVPYTHVNIFNPDSTNGQTYVLSSPFIIAMKTAGIRVVSVIAVSKSS